MVHAPREEVATQKVLEATARALSTLGLAQPRTIRKRYLDVMPGQQPITSGNGLEICRMYRRLRNPLPEVMGCGMVGMSQPPLGQNL